MTRIEINGSDNATTRLFHLDLPPEAIERFTTQAGTGEWPLKYALGAKALKSAFVDVVAIRDLGEMALTQYLTSAHGVKATELKPFKAQVDSLKGHVLVLPAPAFERVSQTLTVATPLRWIGSFGEVAPRNMGPALRSASAKGGLAAGAGPAPKRMSGLLTLALIGAGIVALLVLALVLR